MAGLVLCALVRPRFYGVVDGLIEWDDADAPNVVAAYEVEETGRIYLGARLGAPQPWLGLSMRDLVTATAFITNYFVTPCQDRGVTAIPYVREDGTAGEFYVGTDCEEGEDHDWPW